MKKLRLRFVAFALLMNLAAVSGRVSAEEPRTRQVANVIVMIPDGLSGSALTLARWFKGDTLSLDEIPCGLIRTYSADSMITESASAATAFATGFKTDNGYLGVLPEKGETPGTPQVPEGIAKYPVANVMEAARLAKMATGIVTTTEVMHATPAAFAVHFPDRRNFEVIAEQEVYSGIDVFMGGGARFLSPENRVDKENLWAELEGMGYGVARNSGELAAMEKSRFWALFAPGEMEYDIDRTPEQPSLAEMTEKAIKILSRNKNGFLLMVEGGKIDKAAHANDPAALVGDVLAFDAAVKVALDFAKRERSTAVIVLPDHSTGGLCIGSGQGYGALTDKKPNEFIAPLKRARRSAAGTARLLKPDMKDEKIMELIGAEYGIKDLSPEEMKAVRKAMAGELGGISAVLGPMLSSRAFLGWATRGHSAEDTILFAMAPNWIPSGTIQNNDIATRVISRYLMFNLKNTSQYLFHDAFNAFKKLDAKASIDSADPENPVLTAEKDGKLYKFPAFKNYAVVEGEKVRLGGITLYNTAKWFIPEEGVELLIGRKK